MRPSRPARTVATVAAAAFLSCLTVGLAACSGSDGTRASPLATSANSANSATPVSAEAALLTSAAKTLDSAKAVRLRLSSSDVPTTGTRLVAGQGTMVRTGNTPTGVSAGAFRGSVSLLLGGNRVTVPVVSTGGKVYAKVPGQAKYQAMNLAAFGIGDPAKLFDPKTGISQVFSKLTGVTAKGGSTIGGAPVQQVQGTIPGELVGQLLAGTGSSAPVTARLAIDPATSQLRRIVLRGPLFAKSTTSTYTLNLDRYGVVVPIKAPAA